MKKFTALLLVLFMALVLVGCAGVSESYAEKVNKAAEADEHLLYADVIEDLGEAQIDLAGDVPFVGVSGICTWLKGCEDVTEAKAKVSNGETVYALTITFGGDKALSASWDEWKPE